MIYTRLGRAPPGTWHETPGRRRAEYNTSPKVQEHPPGKGNEYMKTITKTSKTTPAQLPIKLRLEIELTGQRAKEFSALAGLVEGYLDKEKLAEALLRSEIESAHEHMTRCNGGEQSDVMFFLLKAAKESRRLAA
jgi:hypothetical protein